MSTKEARQFADVLGVQVEALDMERTLTRVEDALSECKKGYVCMVGVHGIMEAHRSPSLSSAYAGSMIAVPDGMPIVWVGRLQGCDDMRRVAGPDLMIEIFRRKEFASYTHFLYGGKFGVAEKLSAILTQRFPWARIVGTYMPPFRNLSQSEEEDLIEVIHERKPDIVWVGISTPKQEQFMRRYLPMLETTLMFGVGAAFDFHTGRIRDSSEWLKRAGLQWLHRLVQDPRHLWWRYLRNNPEFMWRIALQLSGIRSYRTAETAKAMDLTLNSSHSETRVLHDMASKSVRVES
jgi:N-acetylglucosaminyldiphosphoundecaprenol N-acetyl-beta-D-mannosaminyltransferase